LDANALVKTLGQVVLHEFLDQVPYMSLAEYHELVQTLVLDGLDESFGRRAGCSNRARPDPWEPRASNRSGPPDPSFREIRDRCPRCCGPASGSSNAIGTEYWPPASNLHGAIADNPGMSLSRAIVPGRRYLITRCCSERRRESRCRAPGERNQAPRPPGRPTTALELLSRHVRASPWTLATCGMQEYLGQG